MAIQTITILPIGEVEFSLLEYIGKCIKKVFHLNIEIVASQEILNEIPEPVFGGKFNSTTILKSLCKSKPSHSHKMLAVTEIDLYSPIFACFFGEAQLGGGCALVSLHRLRQEYYNLEADHTVFLSRCEKEVIHEISHTYGLVHCVDKNCIMFPSNNIIDTDVKSNSFCSNCQSLLRRAAE